jgi:DNA-binding protein H-NS
MAKSLAQIQAQIAGSAKPKPTNGAKTTGNKIAVKKPAVERAVARAPVAIKYRDGHGNTWTGRGSMPRWLRTAVENGMSLEDFSVKA